MQQMIGHAPPDPESPDDTGEAAEGTPPASPPACAPVREIGGREGPEPTRFGDWEKNGRCIDF